MPRIPLRRTQHRHGAVLCRDDDAKIPPRNYFFHRQADSHYASNLNHKLSPVMRIEDKEKPAYLLGQALHREIPKPAGAIPAIPSPGPLFHPLVPLHCGQRDQVGVKQRFFIKESRSAPVGDPSSCTPSPARDRIATWRAKTQRILFELSLHKYLLLSLTFP